MADLHSLAISFANVSTILLCIILKVPQMSSLLRSQSAKGISLPSILLELASFTIGLCYNACNGYELSSYLEYPFLVIQDVILLILVLHFLGKLGLQAYAGLAAYAAVVYAFISGLFPHPIIVTLMSMCTPISAASKLAQLRAMWEAQDSRAVSILTWSIAAYTCITRIFTVLDRGFDGPLLTVYAVSLVLNLAIIGLAFYLRRSPPKKGKKQ